MSRDEVLSKIRKLHDLAHGRNATPGEAAAAAAKVQSLLFAHRLTMREVEKAGAAADEPYAVHGREVGGPGNVRRQLQHLACTVARHNFCTGLLSGGSVAIVGREADVEVVWWLYTYLRDELLRLARESAKREQPGANPYPWIRAFLVGATREIGTRLHAQHEESRKATEASTAMVLVTDAALTDAVARFFPKLGTARSSSLGQVGAFAHGREAGRRIGLNRPLSGGRVAGALGG